MLTYKYISGIIWYKGFSMNSKGGYCWNETTLAWITDKIVCKEPMHQVSDEFFSLIDDQLTKRDEVLQVQALED